jgi:P27 family predicted phage terminase small subunit
MATGRRDGRPAKPTEAKRALGNPGKRKMAPAPTPETALAVISDRIPDPPDKLGDVGRDVWRYVWEGGRRWLSEAQDAVLIARLAEKLEEVANLRAFLGDRVENRWYKTANGQIVTHPAVKQIDQADAQITAWLSMLGFSPSDRARLGLAEIRVANELDQLRQRKAGRASEGVGAGVVDASA